MAAGCLAPSPKESGLPNETPAVHICRRGDGSAIRAVGRGVPPSRMVGRSLRDRRSGRPRLSRPFGEAALMPLHLVGPARRAGRRLTGNAAFQAAHHPPPTHHPPTHQPTNPPPTNYPPTHHPRTTHLTHLTKSSSALSLSLPIWYTYFATFGRTLQDSPVTRPAAGRWIHQNREARLFVRKRETNERTEEQNWTQSARRHLLAVKREGCRSLCRRRNDG